MNTADQEIFSFAKEIKTAYPAMTGDDLKKALAVKFIGGTDTLPSASAGCCADPLGDYVALLSVAFNSLWKVVTQDKEKLLNIQTKIDQAVEQLMTIR